MTSQIQQQRRSGIGMAAGTTVALGLAAFGAAVLTFGDIGSASPNTTKAALVLTVAKADKLCADQLWPPTDQGCLRALSAKLGGDTKVRVIGPNTVIAERAVSDQARIAAAFASLEPRLAAAGHER